MSGWASVKADLLTFLPTLTGLTASDSVSNGESLSQGERETFAVVGSNGDASTSAGWFEQVDDPIDTLLSETGEMFVLLVARSGGGDLDALHATIDGWLTSLRQHFRADQTLGHALSQGSTVTVGRVDINQSRSANGAIVEGVVSIRYFTRL